VLCAAGAAVESVSQQVGQLQVEVAML
jgi:hypothetical protein